MSLAAFDSTMDLCSVDLKVCKNGLTSNISGENILLYIPKMTEMEWVIGMLDILGQKIILTFHHPISTGPQTGSFGEMCQIGVEQG